jgi:uncharacterized protein YbaR (Trm112 family)
MMMPTRIEFSNCCYPRRRLRGTITLLMKQRIVPAEQSGSTLRGLVTSGGTKRFSLGTICSSLHNQESVMPVDGKLLEILCCPVSKTPLNRLEHSKLEKLNQAIAAGDVDTIAGEKVKGTLREALITSDNRVIYPVVDDIPLLLEEKGIGTTQLAEF